MGWRAPMLFAAIGAVTLIAYAVWPSFAEICPEQEVLSYCAREWIGAASGWIAAIAAAVAIGPLLGQLREQTRQTQFVTGGASATLSASHPKGSIEDAALRLVNWNRFPADIMDVRGSSRICVVQIAVGRVIYPDQEVDIDYDGPFEDIVRIGGWEDRAKRPPAVDITLYLVSPDPKPDIIPVDFEVDLLVYADMPYRQTLHAFMYVRSERI